MTRELNETILLHCWHGIFTVNVTFLKPQNIILLKNWQLRGSQLHEWRRMDTSFHYWPLFIDKYKSPIQFHIYSHKIISYTNISHGKINKQEKTHFISVTYFGRTCIESLAINLLWFSDNIYLDLHWLGYWCVVWRRHVTAWTNPNLLLESVRSRNPYIPTQLEDWVLTKYGAAQNRCHVRGVDII